MKTSRKALGTAMVAAQLLMASVPVSAQEPESYRKGLWEFILSPQYMLAKNLGFDVPSSYGPAPGGNGWTFPIPVLRVSRSSSSISDSSSEASLVDFEGHQR